MRPSHIASRTRMTVDTPTPRAGLGVTLSQGGEEKMLTRRGGGPAPAT
jgi:hypothetical protein